MSYLLYVDALGMQEHYNKNFKVANAIMDRVYDNATTAFSGALPELGVSLKTLKGSSLTIMNDSVFIHAEELKYLIHVAAKFAKLMFVPDRKQPPIAFRGSIARTKNIPILEHKKNENLSFSKLVVDNISAAMIADKKKVIGARILIPKPLIDFKEMREWHLRFQSLVMDVNTSIKSTTTDILKKGFEDFYDVAWMISEEETMAEKIRKNLYEYWLKAIYNERASLHASATMLLFEACVNRRNGIQNVLRLLGNGLKKAGKLDVENGRKMRYAEWIGLSKQIKNLREEGLFIPPTEIL